MRELRELKGMGEKWQKMIEIDRKWCDLWPILQEINKRYTESVQIPLFGEHKELLFFDRFLMILGSN